FPDWEAHLCPVRGVSQWLLTSQLKRGYLFPAMRSGDRIAEDNSVPMTTEQFLELFRNNLIDIKVDPHPYGTHSFRRGGCQWLAVYKRWTLRKICEWAGWSMNFTHLTIVKYLISSNDEAGERREEFFKPNRKPATRCYSCGRTCHCS
ncbi:hypothetical protein PLICRDRAFT_119728, partial [Plicaturopsis crispa FD-325 SS-3]